MKIPVIASLAAAAMATFTLLGQAQQDFSAVQIKTTKISPNFYTLEGSGGMIGV